MTFTPIITSGKLYHRYEMICKLYQYIENAVDMPMMNPIVGAKPGIAWKQSSARLTDIRRSRLIEHRNDLLPRSHQPSPMASA